MKRASALTVTVSDKGQVVIPGEMRKELGIVPGCRLDFVQDGATLRVLVRRRKVPTRHVDGCGMLVYRGLPHRLSDFDAAAVLTRPVAR